MIKFHSRPWKWPWAAALLFDFTFPRVLFGEEESKTTGKLQSAWCAGIMHSRCKWKETITDTLSLPKMIYQREQWRRIWHSWFATQKFLLREVCFVLRVRWVWKQIPSDRLRFSDKLVKQKHPPLLFCYSKMLFWCITRYGYVVGFVKSACIPTVCPKLLWSSRWLSIAWRIDWFEKSESWW